MRIHIVARDADDLERLKVAADKVAAGGLGLRVSDCLLFSDDGDEFVNVVTLSPGVARRLAGPGLCDAGRRALLAEVVEAVRAESSRPSGAVH